MTDQQNTRLSIEEAARLIFNTSQPDYRQVGQVRQLIVQGVLKGDQSGRWSTSSQAVAAFLTSRSQQHRLREEKAKPTGRIHKSDLQPLYSDILKDYFMAVIRRRDVTGASRRFRNAVIAGQVVLLLGILGLLWSVYRTVGPTPWTSEQSAVVQHLELQHGPINVVEWFPQEQTDQGARVRLRFQYRTEGSGKVINSDRTFFVIDDVVVEQTTED